MKIKKLKNKLNYIAIIFSGLIFTFNFAQAAVSTWGTVSNNSENNIIIEEAVPNILHRGLGIIFLLSIPFFIIGVYKSYKDKKRKKKNLRLFL